ncbi:hypothetical protein KOW79_005767 [Hemibagrus wyckioides]|uniref:B30.2/SPRY domain-containing protein n=1 Tax=Hemibagrus wyckioides TaxID=337641 RepID=A0A9D3P2M6_9TELE|nr:hypothetical protein KOW79_005767 [Hemibagrus wyckioides]
MKFQQRIQEMQKVVQELQQAVDTIKEEAELIRAERLLEQLEEEIADLQRRFTELSFQSLCVSSGRDDSSSITVSQRLSFDALRKSLSDLKKRLEEIHKEKYIKIPERAVVPSEPSREYFLNYFCYLTLDENTAHRFLILSEKDKVVTDISTATERNQKQSELKEEQRKSQQRIQEKQKKVQELKQAANNLKLSAQTAVEDNDRIFNELISSMEKKRSEVTELIRAQEKAELSRAERLLEQLEQEIADLQRRVTELEQLSHTHDHIHFLQTFQFLCAASGCKDSPSIIVSQHPSFYGVGKSLSDMKKRLEEFCEEDFIKIPEHAAGVQMILPSQTREDLLQYFCTLTLDPNTGHRSFILSEKNTVVTRNKKFQRISNHPERFDSYAQVLSKESLCGRCYWEVEWKSEDKVFVSVSYKEINRKGWGNDCMFGHNNQSWSLMCSSSTLSFWHNNSETVLDVPSSSRIGVYVDHSAGTLSFYSVSDTMKLLHRVHTTFTQPLYAGFWIWDSESSVRLCDAK